VAFDQGFGFGFGDLDGYGRLLPFQRVPFYPTACRIMGSWLWPPLTVRLFFGFAR
jgi:hypothetical protein